MHETATLILEELKAPPTIGVVGHSDIHADGFSSYISYLLFYTIKNALKLVKELLEIWLRLSWVIR